MTSFVEGSFHLRPAAKWKLRAGGHWYLWLSSGGGGQQGPLSLSPPGDHAGAALSGGPISAGFLGLRAIIPATELASSVCFYSPICSVTFSSEFIFVSFCFLIY